MATITNLYAKYAHPNGYHLPALVLVHGWSGDATSFDGDDTLARLAGYGFFVIVPGMRGRNSADGTRDASGREIYDLYDALVTARALYGNRISSDLAVMVGFSAGGGNALAAACKFPDTFTTIVSMFGISDYGRSGTDGWYFNNGGSYTAEIAASVGNTPALAPNNYYARDATAAISNYTGGSLYLFHSPEDATVPPVHSTRIGAAMDAAGLTNYTLNSSTDWAHGYPADVPGLVDAEAVWKTAGLTNEAWTVPVSGTHTVIGYIVTKQYTCWLRANGSTIYGLDAAATVAYNTAADSYTVTPLTGAIDVSITQGAKTGTATNITEATVITAT